jgi:sec-independent protein translocase protein TatC
VNAQQPATPSGSSGFDPDDYRMTIGEHLEELRRRLILALVGLVAAFAICLTFGKQVMTTFCAPLLRVLSENEINPQVYFTGVGDPFLVYIKVSLISAAAIAAPWIVWQFWLFIAAGLYPHERKVITRYVPLSIALLLGGMAFVYTLVLPWTLQFFLIFSQTIPMPDVLVRSPTTLSTVPMEQRVQIPEIAGDPADPLPHELWFDSVSQRYKTYVNGRVRAMQLLPESLAAPMITLPDYVSLVLAMLITFALAFQMPLVVLALERVGIVEVQQLREMRRYVYFAMVVAAAIITPGDVITATVALIFPLIGLYELGIVLARWRRRDPPPATPGA